VGNDQAGWGKGGEERGSVKEWNRIRGGQKVEKKRGICVEEEGGGRKKKKGKEKAAGANGGAGGVAFEKGRSWGEGKGLRWSIVSIIKRTDWAAKKKITVGCGREDTNCKLCRRTVIASEQQKGSTP